MWLRFRSIPLLSARTILTIACVGVAATWAASRRWTLERHWIDLNAYPVPAGWVIITNGRFYWGCKNGNAVGGFNADATVQYHAWDRHAFISVPPPDGQFSLLPDVIITAAAALPVWIVPPVLAWRRRQRGLCDCGYDLKGLPRESPCPECGVLRAVRAG